MMDAKANKVQTVRIFVACPVCKHDVVDVLTELQHPGFTADDTMVLKCCNTECKTEFHFKVGAVRDAIQIDLVPALPF